MNLHVETFGASSGAPILVLHGSGAPPASLRAWAEALSDDHRVLLPHRNGYGETGVHEYAPEAELEALLRIADGPVHVLGHSFGAYRGFQLAARAPDRVEQVIAVGPIAGLPEEARPAVEGLAQLLRSGADITEAAATRWLTPHYLADHPEAVETIREWVLTIDNETVARENLEVLDGWKTLTGFAQSGVPAKMYVGALDQATPPALAHAIAEQAPDADVTVVEAMGHLPMVEDPDGSLDWVRRALRS